jgi:hypothetical protein
MKESDVEKYFVLCVKQAGGEQRKFVSPGRRYVTDRICGFPVERFAFVELKRPGKDAEEGQKREHNRWRKLGFMVFVIDTKAKVDSFIQWMTRP